MPAKLSVGLPCSASFEPKARPRIFLFGHPSSQSERDALSKRKIGGLKMEESKKEKSCEQRIDKQMRGRLEQFFPDVNTWSVLKCARYLKQEGRQVKTTNIDELREEVFDRIREAASENLLSVEKITTYKLCLSWGGPADYFELDWSEESKSWVGGRYVFQDWFDGANRTVSEQQAEELAQLFGICPEVG
jgi:hypothetical protein